MTTEGQGMNTMPTHTRPLPVVLLAAAALFAAGCHHSPYINFPYGMSIDRHNFVSTHHLPLSLELVDTTDGETVWTLDIPVGQMAVVDFERDVFWEAAGPRTGTPAHTIRWGLFDHGSILGRLSEKQELSGRPVLLKVAVREQDAAPSEFEPLPRPEAPPAPEAPEAPADPDAPDDEPDEADEADAPLPEAPADPDDDADNNGA